MAGKKTEQNVDWITRGLLIIMTILIILMILKVH